MAKPPSTHIFPFCGWIGAVPGGNMSVTQHMMFVYGGFSHPVGTFSTVKSEKGGIWTLVASRRLCKKGPQSLGNGGLKHTD